MSPTWVGLDVGTSSIKAVVFDEGGSAVAEAKTVTPWTETALGTEMDPAELGAAAIGVIERAVRGRVGWAVPAGIGITSMGETGVLVDTDGKPLGNAIAWHDQRDSEQVAALEADVGRARFAEITGKPLRAQFSLTKFAWQLQNTSYAAHAHRRFSVADWIARLLTGVDVCDLSLAGRTGWFDPLDRSWSSELLGWSGARAELMPPLVRPGDAVGAVKVGSDALDGAVVTTAGHDHQAAMLGSGLDQVGDELDSCGTAEAIVRIVPDTLDRRVMQELALASVTTDIGVQPGTLCLLGGTEGGRELHAALAEIGIGLEDLPRLDDVALGVAPAGNQEEEEAAKIWRRAVEHTTRQAADLHDEITSAVGPHERLTVAGGWRHSRTVLDGKRRRLGAFDLSGVSEAGAGGAAILAARATGDLEPDGGWGNP